MKLRRFSKVSPELAKSALFAFPYYWIDFHTMAGEHRKAVMELERWGRLDLKRVPWWSVLSVRVGYETVWLLGDDSRLQDVALFELLLERGGLLTEVVRGLEKTSKMWLQLVYDMEGGKCAKGTEDRGEGGEVFDLIGYEAAHTILSARYQLSRLNMYLFRDINTGSPGRNVTKSVVKKVREVLDEIEFDEVIDRLCEVWFVLSLELGGEMEGAGSGTRLSVCDALAWRDALEELVVKKTASFSTFAILY